VLNTMLGWWWADSAAALGVAAYAVGDGRAHWRSAAPHLDDPAAP